MAVMEDFVFDLFVSILKGDSKCQELLHRGREPES